MGAEVASFSTYVLDEPWKVMWMSSKGMSTGHLSRTVPCIFSSVVYEGTKQPFCSSFSTMSTVDFDLPKLGREARLPRLPPRSAVSMAAMATWRCDMVSVMKAWRMRGLATERSLQAPK